jgi:hypothetical protein
MGKGGNGMGREHEKWEMRVVKEMDHCLVSGRGAQNHVCSIFLFTSMFVSPLPPLAQQQSSTSLTGSLALFALTSIPTPVQPSFWLTILLLLKPLFYMWFTYHPEDGGSKHL